MVPLTVVTTKLGIYLLKTPREYEPQHYPSTPTDWYSNCLGTTESGEDIQRGRWGLACP